MQTTLAEPHVHLRTRDEYYKMAEMGMFGGKHVELIEGRIIETSPMGSLHATGVSLAGRILENAFWHGFFARWQMPLDAGELSEPEPDMAIIRGDVRDFKEAHPKTAVLILEIAETSLTYDELRRPACMLKLVCPTIGFLI